MTPGGFKFWLTFGFIVGYTCLVRWVDAASVFEVKKLAGLDDVLGLSVVMGALFIFRINTAYDRWWEARKLWGQLVNETRNLAIKAKELASPSHSECELFAALLVGFACALRRHLRGEVLLPPVLASQISPAAVHVPVAVSKLIYQKIRQWNRQNLISDVDLLQLDRHARSFMDVCGGSERILKSPVSLTLRLLLWTGLVLYVLVMPWILVPENGDSSIFLMVFGSYFTLVVEFVAQEIEEPFGKAVNDLPLDAICLGIESSVNEIMSTSCRVASGS